MRSAIIKVSTAVTLAAAAAILAPHSATAVADKQTGVSGVAVSANVETVVPASAPCGRTAPDRDNSSWPRQTAGVSANMRSGSSTNCAVTGWADNRDQLDYHCFTNGTGGTWTYLRNVTDNTTGWVKDTLLPRNGSSVFCGF